MIFTLVLTPFQVFRHLAIKIIQLNDLSYFIDLHVLSDGVNA